MAATPLNTTSGVMYTLDAGATPGGSDTQVQFNDGGSDLGGDAGLTYDKTNDVLTLTRAGLGVTSADGIVIRNTTDAAAGAQQMSPRLRFHGEGWKTNATAASQDVDAILELLPVQGTANPTFDLVLKGSINGGAYASLLTLRRDSASTSTLRITAASGGAIVVMSAGGDPNVGTENNDSFDLISNNTTRWRIRADGHLAAFSTYKICAGGVISPLNTVTTLDTAGDVTFTAAQVVGGLILRDCNGGARADLVPAAADLLAALPGAQVGQAIEFTIRNTSGGATAITVTTNTGVTLSGTMTIAQNNSKRFMAVFTSITGASEAYTLYSLGTVVH